MATIITNGSCESVDAFEKQRERERKWEERGKGESGRGRHGEGIEYKLKNCSVYRYLNSFHAAHCTYVCEHQRRLLTICAKICC